MRSCFANEKTFFSALIYPTLKGTSLYALAIARLDQSFSYLLRPVLSLAGQIPVFDEF
jgi:hypothetical protein